LPKDGKSGPDAGPLFSFSARFGQVRSRRVRVTGAMPAAEAVSRGDVGHRGSDIGLLPPHFRFLLKFDRQVAET